jgi:hypothetical protein
MRRAADAEVLQFPSIGRPLPVKARLRPNIEAGVQRIITLAPVLGRCNPDAVATVEEVMRNLIGPPPHGGLERTARGKRHVVRARHPVKT